MKHHDAMLLNAVVQIQLAKDSWGDQEAIACSRRIRQRPDSPPAATRGCRRRRPCEGRRVRGGADRPATRRGRKVTMRLCAMRTGEGLNPCRSRKFSNQLSRSRVAPDYIAAVSVGHPDFAITHETATRQCRGDSADRGRWHIGSESRCTTWRSNILKLLANRVGSAHWNIRPGDSPINYVTASATARGCLSCAGVGIFAVCI